MSNKHLQFEIADIVQMYDQIAELED